MRRPTVTRIAARLNLLEPQPPDKEPDFDEHDLAYCKALLVYRERLDPEHIAIARVCLAAYGAPRDIVEIEERRRREHIGEHGERE